MVHGKAKDIDVEKLVNDTPLVSLDIPLPERTLTKKRIYRIRRIAEPHIRAHMSKGRPYYYYLRGKDKEEYLGDADYILSLVLKERGKTKL